jgi:hypothetical protein
MKEKDIVYFIIFGLLIIWGLNNIYFIYQTHLALKQPLKEVEDKEYAKNIKMEMYLMTPEQVSLLFKNNTNEKPEYWVYNEKKTTFGYATYHKPLFLVVRLKNEGPLLGWGLIRYYPYNQPDNTMQILPLPPQMKHFTNYVIPCYLGGISLEVLGSPEIPKKWELLYVQK